MQSKPALVGPLCAYLLRLECSDHGPYLVPQVHTAVQARVCGALAAGRGLGKVGVLSQQHVCWQLVMSASMNGGCNGQALWYVIAMLCSV